jgi:bacillolysin
MKKLFFFIINLLLLISLCTAQEIDKNIRIKRDEKGIIQSISFRNPDIAIKVPESAGDFLKEYLEIGQDDNFSFAGNASKKPGFRHEHYDQYYHNVRVEGGGYNFHFENNKLVFACGNYIKIQSLNSVPTISIDQAKKALAKNINI